MRFPMFLALLVFGGDAAQAASSFRQSGQCYTLTKKCDNNPVETLRDGKPIVDPLSPDFVSLCALIQKLKDLESRCGITAPAGARSGQTPGEILEGMLLAGDLCKETAADPDKVGASASNPKVGNGKDDAGCDYTTTGHPGINISPGHIPRLRPDGGFSVLDQMRSIGTLLHELHHLNNTNAPPSQADYEDGATAYAIREMCKVAGCDSATQEEKDGACAFIGDQNRQRCAAGLQQICCAECEDGGKIHCEGSSGGAGAPGSSQGSGRRQGIYFLDTTTSEFFDAAGLRGDIVLNVALQEVRFRLWDVSDTVTEFAADLRQTPNFWAVSFTQIDDTALLVGGWDPAVGGGKLVRVDYDPWAGLVLAQTLELHDPGMTVASSLDRFPTGSKVAVGDHAGDAVYVYDSASGTLGMVANASSFPTLATMNFVHVWPVPGMTSSSALGSGRSGRGQVHSRQPLPTDGVLIWFTRWHERAVNQAILLGNSVHIVDRDNDGIFEQIY